MLFNSVSFLVFFPTIVIAYFLIPHRIRWVWLLGASYFFYMSWNPQYALLLMTSTIVTFFSGTLIDRAHSTKDKKRANFTKKIYVFLSFSINLAILFFFKYYNFFIDNMNAFASQINIEFVAPEFDILLPVGISFYTFQALSYTMDIYRGDVRAEKNFGKYALYVSFFPQLVAGPIERSTHLLPQMHEKHSFDYRNVKNGLILMGWGFFMKIVVADRVAIIVDQVYNHHTQYQGFVFIFATILFAIQIYCDFGGYSNIAIGAAQIMGFRIMTNFNTPYFALSIRDFWKRWHISLSTWFRDYLYIPLGGNRKGKFRKYVNLLLTFLISGLWHGAAWTFVIWGGLHGLYQVIGDLTRNTKTKISESLNIRDNTFGYKFIQGIITFCLIDFAWLFFRANSMDSAVYIMKNTVAHLNPGIFFDGTLFELGLDRTEFFIMLVSIVVLLLVDILKNKIDIRLSLEKQPMAFRWAIYIVGFYYIFLFGVYGPAYDQSAFIYFQF